MTTTPAQILASVPNEHLRQAVLEALEWRRTGLLSGDVVSGIAHRLTVEAGLKADDDPGLAEVQIMREAAKRFAGVQQAALQDGQWYVVQYEGFGETSRFPAMYRANAEAFYSYEFSGIPAQQVVVIREINIDA